MTTTLPTEAFGSWTKEHRLAYHPPIPLDSKGRLTQPDLVGEARAYRPNYRAKLGYTVHQEQAQKPKFPTVRGNGCPRNPSHVAILLIPPAPKGLIPVGKLIAIDPIGARLARGAVVCLPCFKDRHGLKRKDPARVVVLVKLV